MSMISLGPYASFPFTTQKETDGGRNTFSFNQMIGLNTVMPIPGIAHVFLPEFGFVIHGRETDDYKKTTMYFLTDVGFLMTERLILRYGFGTFLTKISGDGKTLTLPNGDSTAPAYQPKEGETSWNTTLDLGIEFAFNAHNALRFQTYLFSFLSSARQLSYSLNYSFYL